MPAYHVTSPDGQTFEVNAPDGATQEQVLAYAKANMPKAKPKGVIDTLKDTAKSLATGVGEGWAPIADTVIDAGPLGTLKRAADMANMFSGKANPKLQAPSGVNMFSGAVADHAHAPETTPGQYARTIGQFTPNFFAPGEGMAARVANVVAPAIGSETAGQVAHAAGAGPKTEAAARIIGGVAGAGVGSLRPTARSSAAKPAPPTLESLEAQKNAAYQAVDKSGVAYTPDAFRGLTKDMASAVDAEGFNAGLHPKTAAMMERLGLSQRGAKTMSPTLTQLDQLRQQIGRDVASSPDAGERRMGTLLRNQIDDFIAKAGPDKMTGGDAAVASALIAKARDLNTRVAKLRSLENLDDAATDRAAATGTGANSGNALRQNIIRFQRDTPNLTPEEQAATRKAIRGGPIQNITRAVGSLSPEGGTVRAATSIATGVMSGGKIPAVGYVAKRVSDLLAARNVQALRDLIASGGRPAQEVTRRLSAPENAALRAQVEARERNMFQKGAAVGAGALAFSATPAMASEQRRRSGSQ